MADGRMEVSKNNAAIRSRESNERRHPEEQAQVVSFSEVVEAVESSNAIIRRESRDVGSGDTCLPKA